MTKQPVRPRGRPTTEWQAPPRRPVSVTPPPRRPVTPPGQPARPARRARQGRSLSWELTLALLALAIVVATAATFLIVEMWLADRVLPGVYAWDVDLGGLTRAEAVERLQSDLSYPADRHPVLRHGDQAWPVDPAAVGTQLDVEATVDRALLLGHGGALLDRVGEQLSVLLQSRLVMPVYTFEPGATEMALSQVAREINRPLRNATLRLGEGLQVEVVPGQAGTEVNVAASRDALQQRVRQMGGGEVPLVVRESAPLLTDLTATQAEVQRILSGPVVLSAPDAGPWTIDPETLARWLVLRPAAGEGGQATLAVSLDPGQLAAYAAELAVQVAVTPTNAQFRFDEGSGGLVAVVDSVPGRSLDVTATVSLIDGAARSEARAVELPLLARRPAIATEDGPALGVVELVGEGTTRFSGSSASRIQNIKVGAWQFDGLLIAPGETFSFNDYLGEVTAEKGYEESIIIWGNTTRADVGGGLCQVSSTAFRAAFWAGLPVVERWAHAFRVAYYEPPLGMDATIYSPQVDLKWVNDTGHHILIQTYVDEANQTLTFRYYGTNPGRTVELDGPYESNPMGHGPAVYREDPTLPKGQTKQIEWAKDGLDVTVNRIVKENGVEVRRDSFFSRYRPWQAVFLVGTKASE